MQNCNYCGNLKETIFLVFLENSSSDLLQFFRNTFWGVGGAEVVMLLNTVSKYLYNLYYIGAVESFNTYFWVCSIYAKSSEHCKHPKQILPFHSKNKKPPKKTN